MGTLTGPELQWLPMSYPPDRAEVPAEASCRLEARSKVADPRSGHLSPESMPWSPHSRGPQGNAWEVHPCPSDHGREEVWGEGRGPRLPGLCSQEKVL
jgi:hypothetical protein